MCDNKPKRTEIQLLILLESTENFEVVRTKLGKALNCKFERLRNDGKYMVAALGMTLELEFYKRADGVKVYTLWGRLDKELMYSDHSPYQNLDDYEWLPSVDLGYVFITILQAANCGIWRLPTPQDEQDMCEYAPW